MPEWVVLSNVYSFSNEVIYVEVSFPFFGKFTRQETTLL